MRACTHLRHSVGRGVHELRQVHHALPLVLGHVDALDGGEARVGVPEVLQLQLPPGQLGARQLHKHLQSEQQRGPGGLICLQINLRPKAHVQHTEGPLW